MSQEYFLRPVPDWLLKAYHNEPLVHQLVCVAEHQEWTREKFFEELSRVYVERSQILTKQLVSAEMLRPIAVKIPRETWEEFKKS